MFMFEILVLEISRLGPRVTGGVCVSGPTMSHTALSFTPRCSFSCSTTFINGARAVNYEERPEQGEANRSPARTNSRYI